MQLGDKIVVLRPTGAGKTTVLQMVSGLDKPDAGSVSISGRPMAGVTPARRDVTKCSGNTRGARI